MGQVPAELGGQDPQRHDEGNGDERAHGLIQAQAQKAVVQQAPGHGGDGVNALIQHLGHGVGQHIPDHAAAHAGCHAHQNDEDGIGKAVFADGDVHAHNGEGGKAQCVKDIVDRVKPLFVGPVACSPDAGVHKHHQGEEGHHADVDKAGEHSGRELPQQDIPHNPAAQGGDHGEKQYAEGVRPPFYAHHGPGDGGRGHADVFKDYDGYFHITR